MDEAMLVQDILLTGGSSATIQAMLGLFVQNGVFLEPIDPLANPTILDQLFAFELKKGPGNYVYNVVSTFFRPLAAIAEEPPLRPRLRRFSAVAGAVIPRAYWAEVAAEVMAKGGKQSALYQVLATMFTPR